MKKVILFLVTVFVAGSIYGQKNVTNAHNAKKSGKFEQAATYIDLALDNEKAVVKEKTWRYRGEIYLNIALDSLLFIKHPDALTIARDSYFKAMEVDKKGVYHDEDKVGLSKVNQQAINVAYASFETEQYKKGGDFYMLALDLGEKLNNTVDTVSLYYAGVSYDRAEVNEKAIECFNRCGEFNFQVPNVYFFISRIQKRMGDEEASIQTIKDARVKYPNNQDLIIEELNYYLNNDKHQEAKDNLTQAIKLDPNNKVLHFSLGTIHDKLEETDEAVAAYEGAIAIDGDYTDALFNLGALYYNKAVAAYEMYNDLDPGQTAKMDALNIEIDEYFGKCMPFLEKAYSITPDDVAIMETLKNVYAQVGEDEKYIAIKAKLEGK